MKKRKPNPVREAAKKAYREERERLRQADLEPKVEQAKASNKEELAAARMAARKRENVEVQRLRKTARRPS